MLRQEVPVWLCIVYRCCSVIYITQCMQMFHTRNYCQHVKNCCKQF